MGEGGGEREESFWILDLEVSYIIIVAPESIQIKYFEVYSDSMQMGYQWGDQGKESNVSVKRGSILCEVYPLTSRLAVPLYIFQIFLSRRSMPFPGC